MRILIIEETEDKTIKYKDYLRKKGICFDITSQKTMLSFILTNIYDVIVYDKEKDNCKMIEATLSEYHINTPLMFVDDIEKECLQDSFYNKLLESMVYVNEINLNELYTFEDIYCNQNANMLHCFDERIELSKEETKIILKLINNKTHIIIDDEIKAVLSRDEEKIEKEHIGWMMNYLNHKISDIHSIVEIKPISSDGYRLQRKKKD